MTWLQSHQALRTSPKTRKLGRLVGGLPAAIGHLHCLWWWALDHAPDGDLTHCDAEDIAMAAEWEGDAETFLTHLVTTRFIDRTRDGMFIHDWADHGGKRVASILAGRERASRHYAKSRESLRVDYAQSTDQSREEKRREEEKELLAPAGAEMVVRTDPLEGFKEFWSVYPKRERRRDAEKTWRKMSKRKRARAYAAAQAVAYAVANGYKDLQYTPQGATWLNQERYQDWFDDDGNLIVATSYASQGNGKLAARVAQMQRVSDRIEWPEEDE